MATTKVFALGGLDERGKNLYCVEVDDNIFIFDAGAKNPERGILGIDTVIANFDYLKENKNKIKGIFVSKASDDCSDGITYILKELDIKVYGSALTIAIIKFQLNRFKVRNRENNFVTISAGNTLKFDKYKVDVFQTTTNVPSSFGFVLDTTDGLIVYTGDYIFDAYAESCFSTNIQHLATVGKKNVLLLLSEASSASRMDYTAPNHKILSSISRSISEAQGRIILACFDQDLHKISEFLKLISKKGITTVGIYGPTLMEALQQDIIKDFKTNVTFKPINEIDNSEVCAIIVAGNGERLYSRLIKIAVGNDDLITFNESDTIIFATPPNPGSELNHANVLDELSRSDAKVISLSDRKVWTMTASYEDIKLMCSIIKPKYFVPIKGLYKDFVKAKQAAIDSGMNENNTIILDNGQILNFENGKLKSSNEKMKVGDIYVDGIGVGDIGAVVLNERKQLATDGVMIIGITLDKKTREVTSLIDTQLRGVIYIQDTNDIFKEMQKIVIDVIAKYNNKYKDNENYDLNDLRTEIKNVFTQYIRQQTGKSPIVLVIINQA